MAIKFFNDPSKLWNLTELLLQGAGVTLSIFFLTLLFAVPLGVLFAQARMSKHAVLRAPTSLYIYLMRSTPLMLQIMFVYFLLPQILPFKVDRFSAVIFAFAVNYAAYFAEIFRAGIQAIDKGQYEAARSLGMTYTQTMRRIVLPQVIRHVLLPVSNETITLVKDTSLIYVLAMNDLLRTTRSLVQRDFNIMPFVVAGIFYLLMTLVLTVMFEKLEKKYSQYN